MYIHVRDIGRQLCCMDLIAEDRKQDVSVCVCSGHPFVAVTVFQNKRNIAFVRKQVLSYFRVFAKGRLQLLLITTIVWMSPYVKFTHNQERTNPCKQGRLTFHFLHTGLAMRCLFSIAADQLHPC